MYKFISVAAVIIWLLWAFIAFTDVVMREGQDPLSIVSQMFFSWGLAYAVYIFILLWFIDKIGANKYLQHMERAEEHMQRTEALLEKLVEAQKERSK